jgi:hypothetical protein
LGPVSKLRTHKIEKKLNNYTCFIYIFLEVVKGFIAGVVKATGCEGSHLGFKSWVLHHFFEICIVEYSPIVFLQNNTFGSA